MQGESLFVKLSMLLFSVAFSLVLGGCAPRVDSDWGALLQRLIDKGLVEATLEDSYIASRSKGTIILFKDLHRTPLIQQEIARSLLGLESTIDLDFVGIEGMGEPFSLSFWRDLSETEEVSTLLPSLAWGWLLNNCISASEYYALAMQKDQLEPVENERQCESEKSCFQNCDNKAEDCIWQCVEKCIEQSPSFIQLKTQCQEKANTRYYNCMLLIGSQKKCKEEVNNYYIQCIEKDPTFISLKGKCKKAPGEECIDSCEHDYTRCSKECIENFDRDRFIATSIAEILRRSPHKIGVMQIGGRPHFQW